MELPVLGAKPQLHQSQLGMLYSCPMKYYLRYVRGIRTRPSVPLITGTGTHAAVERNLKSKIDTGSLLDADQVADVARDTVNRVWDAEGVQLSPDEQDDGEQAVRGATVDAAVKLSQLHHNAIAPEIEPVAVERTFLITLDNFPFDVAGTIDVEERRRLRDTKTYIRRPSQATVDSNLQLSVYALWKRTMDGTDPEELVFDVLLKHKEPKVEIYRTRRGEAHYQDLLLRLKCAGDLISAGCFNPCAPDSWVCSSKFCGYYDDICPHGRRARLVA